MDADLKTWISENVMPLDLEVLKTGVTKKHTVHTKFTLWGSVLGSMSLHFHMVHMSLISLDSYESVCWKMVLSSYNINIHINNSFGICTLANFELGFCSIFCFHLIARNQGFQTPWLIASPQRPLRLIRFKLSKNWQKKIEKTYVQYIYI